MASGQGVGQRRGSPFKAASAVREHPAPWLLLPRHRDADRLFRPALAMNLKLPQVGVDPATTWRMSV